MKKICENDGVEFEAKRATAKFCSDKCRVEAARKAGVNPGTGEILDAVGVEVEPGKPTVGKIRSVKVPEHPMPALNRNPNPFAPENRDPNYDREKHLKAFQKMGLVRVDWLSTGLPDFDELTRIPRGRITQIQGPYGVGKTTLCLNMIAGMKNARVLYIDSEASLNPDLLEQLQIDSTRFDLYNKSAYFEDIAEVIKKAAKEGKHDVIILDSLATVTTRTETEGNVTDRNIGAKAFLTHKLIRLVQMDLKDTNTAFVVINQEREVIGSYVPQKYTPGGTGVPYAASLIVALKTIKSWRFPQKPKDGLYLGQEVEATIIKSKVNTPWRTAKFKIYYPNPVPDSDAQPVNQNKEDF